MAQNTYKFSIDGTIYKKNFTAGSYRIALIAAKKWRDKRKPGAKLSKA